MPTTAANSSRATATAARSQPGLVVLVHGIWMIGVELQWLAYQLRRSGFQTHTHHYPSVRQDLAYNAARLAEFLGAQRSGTHVVGHSLGGLISAHAIADYPDLTAGVSRVVMLGSPLLGSATARKAAQVVPFGRRIVGRSFPLEPSGPAIFLDRWTAPQPLGIIAGAQALGLGHNLLRALPLPNDGMVALSETLLPGATAHLTLPVNHVRLTMDRRSIAQTIHFLEHGRFREPDRIEGVDPWPKPEPFVHDSSSATLSERKAAA